ncbi:GNAT family N-acetyltransferase [Xanthomonas hydrangeae]|uniref:GNAT family N-acetyltransferase n=1 Tax=Xanthomonas hydrangeae TaxID=2775159 RepID=A0AAU0BB83_9XANT|nr:GNAT family N-acetyltransferase [Xanthomonas hydrangeae]WOB50325.1 GNAT family N-acetyltransferase [Xanthomonas hydrangeae]
MPLRSTACAVKTHRIAARTEDCGAGRCAEALGSTASLCWGMVHPTLHRQGLGTDLLLARLEALRLTPNIQRVVLDTSQHTQAFYARFGFVAQHVVRDGYGAGLDRWDMALEC